MKKYRLFYMFIFIILAFSSLDILEGNKEFSDFENRRLTKEPKFTLKSYFNGQYSKEYDNYINDQFIMRDSFISVKALMEKAFLKVENNGVYFGEDDYLLEKVVHIDKSKLDLNINSINKFIKDVDLNTYIMIVPNSYYILKDKLPKYALVEDTEKHLDYIYSNIEGEIPVDLRAILKENKEEYIYYKTDHHWTTLGAYLGYEEFMKEYGEEPIKLSNYKENNENDFYGTFYSRSKPVFLDGDTISYYDFNDLEIYINDEKKDSLYDLSFFNTRDKYSAFLHDNNGITRIKNKKISNDKKLLVIKDSYANSLVPFLTQNFSEVIVIDLRYYGNSIKEYIKENNISDVLILYNFINFTRDNSIMKINM